MDDVRLGPEDRDKAAEWDRKTRSNVLTAINEAELKAWDSLSRYKFLMFGYHAAQWVLLNRTLGNAFGNPFRLLVDQAKTKRDLIVNTRSGKVGGARG